MASIEFMRDPSRFCSARQYLEQGTFVSLVKTEAHGKMLGLKIRHIDVRGTGVRHTGVRHTGVRHTVRSRESV